MRISTRTRALLGTALVAGLVVSALPATADPNNNNSAKLRSAVTLDGVVRHMEALQDIADAAGGNRFAGTDGHDMSVEYVVDQLEAAGYSPTLHTFSYPAFFENTPSQLSQTAPGNATYVNGIDFRIMSYSGSGDVTAPATPLGNLGCAGSDWTGFPAGNIALVERGACTFRLKTDNAQTAGASAILIYNNIPGGLNGTLGAGALSTIPSLGLTQSLGQQLAATSGLVMRIVTDTRDEVLETSNVLAELPGRNAGNVVMAGAHLDSVTTGPGINDNGSGSAAILETAIQMAKVKPFNTVRFAWWSAEESGLVGSREYVNNFLTQAQRDEIALYLNFDMIGSPNFVRFVYDGDNSAGGGAVGPAGSDMIERMFVSYFDSQGLESEPTPFNGRSDYGPFIDKGIPAGGLFTGAEGIKSPAQATIFGGLAGIAFDPCYHAACDTEANYDATGLDQMSDAVAHAIISYAQSTASINGAKGKGNFKGDPPSSGNNSGGGGGGGLHDDHEEVAA